MTFLLRHPADGRLHWSDLKNIARSPKHARHALLHPKPPTPAMRLGSAVDAVVFARRRLLRCDVEGRVRECAEAIVASRPYAISPAGARQGKQWNADLANAERCEIDCFLLKEHEAALAMDPQQGDTIVSSAEYDATMGAVEAVMTDPVAAPLLVGRTQVVAQWEAFGLPCAAGIEGERGGFDVLGDGFIADLKVTQTVEPFAWERHAWKMLYPCQLAFYDKFAPGDRELHIIGVEARPPHDVTVLTLSASSTREADKRLCAWTEVVRQCESSGHWPGYVQTNITLEPQAWDADDNGEDE